MDDEQKKQKSFAIIANFNKTITPKQFSMLPDSLQSIFNEKIGENRIVPKKLITITNEIKGNDNDKSQLQTFLSDKQQLEEITKDNDPTNGNTIVQTAFNKFAKYFEGLINTSWFKQAQAGGSLRISNRFAYRKK